MSDAVPMVIACFENQSKQYTAGRCEGCGDLMCWGQSSSAGWYGICGLCAMRVELGLIERPKVRTYWDWDL